MLLGAWNTSPATLGILICAIKQLVARIAALHCTAVMYGAVQLVRLCKDAGVTPIVGNEMYVMHVLPPEAAETTTSDAVEDSCNPSPPAGSTPGSSEGCMAAASKAETHSDGVSPLADAERSNKGAGLTHQESSLGAQTNSVEPRLASSSLAGQATAGEDAVTSAPSSPEIADADEAPLTPKKRTRKAKGVAEGSAAPAVKR